MKINGIPYRSIRLDEADGWSIRILDQTRLPWQVEWLRLTDEDQVAHAIRSMQVRGAPLIGAVAAYGLALAMRRDPAALEPWLARYRQAASDSAQLRGISNDARQGAMRRVNPRFVLRNWIAEEVIRPVRDQADSAPLATVFGLLRAPFDEHPGHERYAEPPPDWACGLSVSCSS